MSADALWALEVFGRIGRRVQTTDDLVRGAAGVVSELSSARATAVLISETRSGPPALALVGQRQSAHQQGATPEALAALRDHVLDHYSMIDSATHAGNNPDIESDLSVSIVGAACDEPFNSLDSAKPTSAPSSAESEAAATFDEIRFCTIRSQIGGAVIGLVCYADAPDSQSAQAIAALCAERIASAAQTLSAHPLEQTLPHLARSIADGLILADKASDAVLINPSARSMLGLDPDNAINQSYLKEKLGFYPFDLVNVSRGSNEPLREEVAIGDIILHSVVSPVRDEHGTLIGVAVVLRDYTEAKALAERQQEFVSVVSHELRTPLTSITGALDITLSEYAGRLSEKQRRYLTLARESCTRLNTIVDDLLDVARSEEGRIPIRFTPLVLDELAQEAVDTYRAAAQAKGIKIQMLGQNLNLHIVGDADRLTQVLNNLLSNALKFTPEGGAIEVEIFGPKVAAGHVGVSVFNNGEPIPEKARERIFEKFEQVQESSTRRVGGTGLGLAISRAIVEAHHGRIWVETREDGTKFVLTLPVAPESDAPTTSELDFHNDAETVGGASILIVDPDVHSRYILKGILMAVGHRVVVAQTNTDVLAAARSDAFDLVSIAHGPDRSSAMSLIEILRHDPETSAIAIVGVGEATAADAFTRQGAADFVAKPLDPTRFLAAISRLIADSKKATSSRILVVDDDLSIRVICREVLSSGGYTVRTTKNADEALEEAKRFRPDLILLDVMMPDLDGFGAAERLRADPATAMTPIIFLSARGATADKLRAFQIGAEDYIVKPFVAAEMLARVKKALERRELELGASPTTQLPGSLAIENEIGKRIGETNVAFCYLDLDNLKAFNDYYGYAKADGVIRQTGDLVRDVIARLGTKRDFIGHIAGDDFVYITASDRVDSVCNAIIDNFDRLVPLYYNKEDRDRGFIETKDRYGVLRRFPVMGVSLAAVTTTGEAITKYSQLAGAAADGKKLAKTTVGSSYVRDGALLRGQPTDSDKVHGEIADRQQDR